MFTTDILISLLTLISLEIILGIDNIIFISIISDKLPENQRAKLRFWGLGLALIMRLVLLFFIAWIMKLDNTLFQISTHEITGKELILILGGLFLIYKSTKEIYEKTEKADEIEQKSPKIAQFRALLIQIILLDLVFSVDSIITAVGMVDELWIMYAAVIVSVTIMIFAAKSISEFIARHPSFKILALCFLILIGVSLIAEGFDAKIPKGYIYCSIAFSFIVDLLQMRLQKKS
jgi:predicted tellurium resistance membrane protein TerC